MRGRQIPSLQAAAAEEAMPVWVVVTVVVGGLKKACELNGHFGTLGGSLPSCALRPSRSRVPSARDTRFPAPSLSAADV